MRRPTTINSQRAAEKERGPNSIKRPKKSSTTTTDENKDGESAI